MLKTKMYVRCPADKENLREPRVFVCGQIIERDELKQTVFVKIHDPQKYLLFFEDLPSGTIELPEYALDRCKFFINSTVFYNGKSAKVLSVQQSQDEYYYYYVQFEKDKSIKKISETELVAAFNNGLIDPCSQLYRYEFQNPCWYLGRTVVSRSNNLLENSIYGFKELAGSKIYLLPHQINTIMRCMQESPCRYMLADEVGMGKTIEAISVFKLFVINNCNTTSLIIVPKALKAQWISELMFKFKIPTGKDSNGNLLLLKSMDEITDKDKSFKWDFVIVDEVHKFVFNKYQYNTLHSISNNSDNVLLLSATPVQQKQEEYLNLLRLLMPSKYDSFTIERFNSLVNKQSSIVQKTSMVLDDLVDYEESIADSIDSNGNPLEDVECVEIFEEIREDLEDICNNLDDKRLSNLLSTIVMDSEDYGVYSIKVVISYICTNYQIESNIIRNRRKILESSDEERKMATRELLELVYSIDDDDAIYERQIYTELSAWVEEKLKSNSVDIEKEIKPLLASFFSSPWAFSKQSQICSLVDPSIKNLVKKWINVEDYNIENIVSIMNDPGGYKDSFSSRLVIIMNALFDEYYDKKVVLFTSFDETFNKYKSALEQLFPNEAVFFGKDISSDQLEKNAYRFQSESDCRIMLCDSTGGEGRNFQCADYLIHIDLPWDASLIEQRIGRLDRLERDLSRPVVYSVVIHAENTFEDSLFKFFKDGLNIFNQSLSGMEIIMRDINSLIISAIKDDFKYGLAEKIPEIVDLANRMRNTIRKEQNFDAAGFVYKPMYSTLRRLIDFYNRNENDLFASTMSSWASLAGFRGYSNPKGEIVYTASSFSPRSAINAHLIPPKWNEYLETEYNKLIASVQSSTKSKYTPQDKSIRGTFSRKLAIENDYLHFFAPGDEVFECIVDNAINSYRGTSSAFAFCSDITWQGFIFTWSVSPNMSYLLDNEVSPYAISTYRNYLSTEQIVVPISIENSFDYSDEQIIKSYNALVNLGFNKAKVVHLGKRSREPLFMSDVIKGRNIDWFINQYSPEKWRESIVSSRKEARSKAFEIMKHKSNINGAIEEMKRILSARVANSEYYGLDDSGIEELEKTLRIIKDSLNKPNLVLDSAAFIIMIGNSNGYQ